MTCSAEIQGWLEEARSEGATHLLVVTDLFDYENFRVLVMPGQNVFDVADEYRTDQARMRKLMEVYSLALPLAPQLAERRAWRYETVEDLAAVGAAVLMEFPLQALFEETGRLERLLTEPRPNLSHWRQATRACIQRVRKLMGPATGETAVTSPP